MAKKTAETDMGRPGQASRILHGVQPEHGPWRIGTAYLIRTVTNYLVGRLAWAGPAELLLEDAAWVADTGRYSDAIAKGSLGEVEPILGPVIVGRGAVVDAAIWTHPLPVGRK